MPFSSPSDRRLSGNSKRARLLFHVEVSRDCLGSPSTVPAHPTQVVCQQPGKSSFFLLVQAGLHIHKWLYYGRFGDFGQESFSILQRLGLLFNFGSPQNECQVTSTHYQGLRSIFLSKDHICRNVANTNYGGYKAY